MSKAIRDMTEPELTDLLQSLGKQITAVCAVLEVEKPMFALLIFNDPEIAQYVCNCERGDVITAMRECAERLEKQQTLERVEFPAALHGFGETGQFPDGQLHREDQGGLTYGVGSDKKIKKVIVTFGKPVAWMGFNAKEALELADTLRWHASKIGE